MGRGTKAEGACVAEVFDGYSIQKGRYVMSMLDAYIPQLVASQSAFGAKAGLMRSTIGQAEQEALSAQAFHAGESAAAFQAAHARYLEVAARVNMLLDIAQANLGDAAGSYVAGDAAAASSYAGFSGV